jgi:O-antigen/teichoic acid export membrane protein
MQSQNIEALKKFIAAAFFRGAGAGSILLLYFVTTQTFQPAQAGHFFFILTLSAVTTPLVLTGLHTLNVKRLPTLLSADAREGFVTATVHNFLRNALSISAGLAILSLALGLRTEGSLWIFISLLTTLILIIPLFNLIGFVFQGLKEYNVSITILYVAMNSLLSILIIVYSQVTSASTREMSHLYGLFVASALITLLLAIILLRISQKIWPMRTTRPKYRYNREDWLQAFRFWLVLALINISNWTPQLLFYQIGGPDAYAYFSVAERLANGINFFVVVSNFVLAPIISELFHSGRTLELGRRFITVTQTITLACLPVAAILTLFPSVVLRIFGDKYEAGASFLMVMALSQLFNVITGSLNTMLNMTGFERQLIASILIGFACQLTTLLVLGPLMGGLGFAIAYAINIIAQNTAAAVYVRRHLGISILGVLKLPSR